MLIIHLGWSTADHLCAI